MKVRIGCSVILLTALIAPSALAGVQCDIEAVDLFDRANQADKESRFEEARSLYTQAAQHCDRSNYWMAVGDIWSTHFLGDSVEAVNQEGGPAIEAYGKSFEAATREGNTVESAAAARALVELGLRAGDPIKANDWLLLAQSLDPSNSAVAELQRKVDSQRAELSTDEIETGLSKTRGVGQAQTILKDYNREPTILAEGTGGSAAVAVDSPDVKGKAGPKEVAGADTSRSISIPINFEYNSTQTTGLTANNIENLATVLAKDIGQGSIVLIGHADTRGDADYNMQLSRKRAEAIRILLESLQPSLVGRISAVGRGELESVDPGDSERAYANNRRLEIVIKG